MKIVKCLLRRGKQMWGIVSVPGGCAEISQGVNAATTRILTPESFKK